MKNNIIPKIIFITLIVILFISIIYVLIPKEKKLTKKMYDYISNNTNYTFTIEEENENINYRLIISKKENAKSIDAKFNDDHSTTLVKDGYAYYIVHSEKEYYLYDSNQIEADIFIDELKDIDTKDYQTGHEKINGKDYYYEEYKGITAFIIWSDYDEEKIDSISTRFYYNKGNISYIKTIIEGSTEELLKVEIKNNVDDSKFEIPEDYAEKE